MSDLIDRLEAINAINILIGGCITDDVKNFVRYTLLGMPSAQQWFPFKTIPMTEEERKEMSEKCGYELEGYDAVWYVSQLPENGQEVLVCNKYGRVWIDTFNNDIDYGCSLDENGDLDGVIAWMPLPEPYTKED